MPYMPYVEIRHPGVCNERQEDGHDWRVVSQQYQKVEDDDLLRSSIAVD